MEEHAHDTCAALGLPGEAHAKLEPFAGTFRGEVQIWMGPGQVLKTTGTMKSSFDLGGRFLRQEYQGDKSEGPFPDFEGRGFWGYNNATRKYEGLWIDSASTMMQTDVGDVDADGKIWTMVGTIPNPQTGEDMTKRSVITLEDHDHHSIEMYFSGDGSGEFKAMEIHYTRID